MSLFLEAAVDFVTILLLWPKDLEVPAHELTGLRILTMRSQGLTRRRLRERKMPMAHD